MENFEQRLSREPLRQIPAGWREEILSAARGAQVAGSRPSTSDLRPSWLSTLSDQLSTLLWPCPKAWAGLVAVWIVIFALQAGTRDDTPAVAQKASPPSPELILALKQQERMLAELLADHPEPRAAEQPKNPSPRPRSELREEMLAA